VSAQAARSVHWGTSSWSEKSWVGPFYPKGTPPGEFLAHYAKQFSSVEADNTYYHAPAPQRVRGWDAKTPLGFAMAAKFPRSIVHAGEGLQPDAQRVLAPAALAEARAFVETMQLLGPKLGPLLLQFPYFNRDAFTSVEPFLERLEPFLLGLPKGARYAVEVRNKDWIGAPLLHCLKRTRTPLVLLDLAYMPPPWELAGRHDLVTGDFLYARLMGNRKAIEKGALGVAQLVRDQSEGLARWAELLGHLAPKVHETFVYASDHYAGFGIDTIRDLKLRFEMQT
jgi:uncharacterized protein YecE (DUF72 family)